MIKKSLDTICKNNELTYSELKENIKTIPSGVIPYKLNEWGISKDQLPKLVTESFTKGRIENNIIDLNEKDVMSVLENIL